MSWLIEIVGPKGSIPFVLRRETKEEAARVAATYKDVSVSVTITEEKPDA